MGNNKLGVNIGSLRSSVQVALLGVIGVQILGICLDTSQTDSIEMVVFVEDVLLDDEKEAFDIAATEIMGDFSPPIPIRVRFVENVNSPLQKCSEIWVFVRYGCQIES